MELFSALGFHWNRSAVPGVVPTHSIERVAFRFHRMLPEFVWDASVLEGNPFTFPEVKTLLDGVTVGGRKISDQEQILNLATSSKHLLALVKAVKFSLDKATFTELHSLVARNEALEWGHFQGEGQETNYTPDVGLGEHGRYTPLATLPGAPELNRVFASGLEALELDVQQPFEKAAAFFLFGALQQFFFDGNKRTSRFMMNGILMSAGIDAISVPAAKAQQFNENMVRFYLEKDATEMMAFLVDCHPDAEQIHEANQSSPTTENDNGMQPATHHPLSIADLELTVWAQEFKADSPVSYRQALEYAQQSRLEVFIEHTNETGEWQWAVRVLDAPNFWMDAKPTKALATAMCRSMGWKIVQ